MKIQGVYCCGDYLERPITFENTYIVINWSYNKLKLELIWKKEETELMLELYDHFANYGEWGEEWIKPICWMKIENNNNKIKKSKTIIGVEEIKNFAEKSEFIKITVYLENVITESSLKNYLDGNTYWIDCLGGLYHIADLYWVIEKEDKSTIEQEPYQTTKVPFDIEDYKNENLMIYAKETAETTKKLIENKQGHKFISKEGN